MVVGENARMGTTKGGQQRRHGQPGVSGLVCGTDQTASGYELTYSVNHETSKRFGKIRFMTMG
jgi:hypothetical protein